MTIGDSQITLYIPLDPPSKGDFVPGVRNNPIKDGKHPASGVIWLLGISLLGSSQLTIHRRTLVSREIINIYFESLAVSRAACHGVTVNDALGHWPKYSEEEITMQFYVVLQPLVALIAGILILLIPRLLNYIVAIYLIIVGITGLLRF